jgi:predicted cobalt transporter CbtA
MEDLMNKFLWRVFDAALNALLLTAVLIISENWWAVLAAFGLIVVNYAYGLDELKNKRVLLYIALNFVLASVIFYMSPNLWILIPEFGLAIVNYIGGKLDLDWYLNI